jgi:PAS domain S-box-containing protein
MQFQATPYVLPLLLASAFSAWIAFYAWRRRTAGSAIWLALLSLTVTEWLWFYALQIAGTNLQTKLLFAEIKYIGVAITPLIWLFFALSYANLSTLLTWRKMAPLSLVPLLTSLIAITTGWHGWFWSQPQLTYATGFSDFSVTYGLWYWVHVLYSYLLILAGTLLVFRTLRHRQGLHRRQALALIISVLTPWLGNILYFSGFNPIPALDLTPFAFTISAGFMTWAILGFRLVDLTPVARDLVVDEMKDGMLVLDTQGQIVDMNLAAGRMLGRPASQMIGKLAAQAFDRWPELVERYGPVTEALNEISVGAGESLRWFELQISPLHDQRRRFLGRVVILRDITARKETEQALSIALHEAQASDRLKSQLLARVSHELRTPLGGILGFAELLNMNAYGDLDDQQKEVVAQIIASTNYLDGMINALLDQAQLEAGTLSLQNELFSPEEVLQKVQTGLAELARAKGLVLKVSLSPELPKMLSGDPLRIEQILSNLLHNAIKFTRQGQVEVSLQLADAAHWTLRVSDTGPGIPEAARAYIFEPFRQVNTAITRENRGTGLGLAITRQLVELMQGEIRLESQPGQGSTFIVTLPVKAP